MENHAPSIIQSIAVIIVALDWEGKKGAGGVQNVNFTTLLSVELRNVNESVSMNHVLLSTWRELFVLSRPSIQYASYVKDKNMIDNNRIQTKTDRVDHTKNDRLGRIE